MEPGSIIRSPVVAGPATASASTTMSLTTHTATLGCLAILLTSTTALAGQSGERFGGRLSRLPVDRSTAPTIMGSGTVVATVDGHSLTITATFEGMSSPATAAHLHQAPRGRRGPVVLGVDVPQTATGKLEQTVDLTDAQLAELREGRYYLQIHTEANAGGELRGWLLPR